MAQLVEHILGKDEVIGSIPISSSKKDEHCSSFFIVAFGAYKIKVEQKEGCPTVFIYKFFELRKRQLSYCVRRKARTYQRTELSPQSA